MQAPFSTISSDVVFGENVKLIGHVNLYGCNIGDDTTIGPFVEIQRDVVVGARCKIQSHTFICSGVRISDEVFVGHGVMFTNDRYPRAVNALGVPAGDDDWSLEETTVERGATIGSGVVILAGVTVGREAMVGAGATVTKDVPPHGMVIGPAARLHE